MRSTYRDSPSSRLMDSFDFRIKSLQQMVRGELMPLERRIEMFQKRKDVLRDDFSSPSRTKSVQTQPIEQGDLEQEDISSEDAEDEEQQENEEEAASHPDSTPSMAEAAGIKMGSQAE